MSAAGLNFEIFSETKFYSEYYTILVLNVVHTYFISKNGNVLCSLSEFEFKHAQYDQNLLTRHFFTFNGRQCENAFYAKMDAWEYNTFGK